jgi:hypothetical protein
MTKRSVICSDSTQRESRRGTFEWFFMLGGSGIYSFANSEFPSVIQSSRAAHLPPPASPQKPSCAMMNFGIALTGSFASSCASRSGELLHDYVMTLRCDLPQVAKALYQIASPALLNRARCATCYTTHKQIPCHLLCSQPGQLLPENGIHRAVRPLRFLGKCVAVPTGSVSAFPRRHERTSSLG